MGLFSGSFGKGLVTGLATSVDKSLRDALDKRDQEMSRARQFLQTRQAQKLDLKEAEDSRAEKALNRLIKEANGDVALGFAAYQAAGGDVDSVEKFLTSYDATKSAKGKFSLRDALILPEGFDTSKMKLTREQAFGAIRTPLKGVRAEDVVVDDPLANIGLGLKGGAANRVADKINGMIQPEEVTRVEGYEGVQLDMTRMLEAEKYAQDQAKFAKAMGPKDLDEKLFMVNEALGKIKREDYETDELFQKARNEQLELRDSVLRDIRDVAKAEDTDAATGVSDSIMRVVWTDTREQGRKLAGIGGKDEERYFTKNGVFTLAINDEDGYRAAVKEADRQSANLFVTTMQSDDGSFTTSAINIIGTDADLKSAYSALTDEQPTKEGETQEEAKASSATVDWSKADNVKANPQGFADSRFAANPKLSPAKLFDVLIRSGVPEDKAQEIAQDIENKQIQAAEAEKNAPKYKPIGSAVTDKTSVNEEGYKVVGNVKWRPDYGPDLTRILRDKNVDQAIKQEALEDYVAMMVGKGYTEVTKENAAKKFGVE